MFWFLYASLSDSSTILKCRFVDDNAQFSLLASRHLPFSIVPFELRNQVSRYINRSRQVGFFCVFGVSLTCITLTHWARNKQEDKTISDSAKFCGNKHLTQKANGSTLLLGLTALKQIAIWKDLSLTERQYHKELGQENYKMLILIQITK